MAKRRDVVFERSCPEDFLSRISLLWSSREMSNSLSHVDETLPICLLAVSWKNKPNILNRKTKKLKKKKEKKRRKE